MQLPKGSGLEVLDRLVRKSIRYYSDLWKSDRFRQNMLPSLKKLPAIGLPGLNELKRPVESIIKGLNNAVSQLTAKPEKIDYNVVVNSFLPPGARLIKPQYPEDAAAIQFADLDGDRRNELVTSYATNEGISTLVLKRDEVQWYKAAEINCPGYTGIHYRNSADITGEGRRDLLLGLSSASKDRTLFAYSVKEGDTKRIFSKKYHKLELLRGSGPAGTPRDAVALWHEESPGIYDIELVRWNGIDLEQLDRTRYLAAKVLPYYIRRLRQDPGDTASWYNLAETFLETGDRVNAARAVRFGLEYGPDAALKERLSELQSRI